MTFSQRIERAMIIAGLVSFAMCASHVTVWAAAYRTGQESVTTAAAEEIGSPLSRYALTIHNDDTTNPVYCGGAAVTSTTGLKVVAGSGYIFDNQYGGQYEPTQSIYCRATGGTVTVSFKESVK